MLCKHRCFLFKLKISCGILQFKLRIKCAHGNNPHLTDKCSTSSMFGQIGRGKHQIFSSPSFAELGSSHLLIWVTHSLTLPPWCIQLDDFRIPFESFLLHNSPYISSRYIFCAQNVHTHGRRALSVKLRESLVPCVSYALCIL